MPHNLLSAPWLYQRTPRSYALANGPACFYIHVVQIIFELTEEGLAACFGTDRYTAQANALAPSHRSAVSSGGAAGQQGGLRGAEGACALPLAPARVVLDFLEHVRDHGLEERRWQEVQAFAEAKARCGGPPLAYQWVPPLFGANVSVRRSHMTECHPAHAVC
jgi:hypothetical protein